MISSSEQVLSHAGRFVLAITKQNNSEAAKPRAGKGSVPLPKRW